MTSPKPILWIGLGTIAVFAVSSNTFAQALTVSTQAQAVSASPVPTQGAALQLSPAEQAFRQEQATLGEQLSALVKQGATSSQIATWQQLVATRQAAQLQRAQALSASHGNIQPLITDVTFPGNASPQLQALITNQVDLANASIQLNNQVAAQGNQTIPAAPTADQDATLRQQTSALRQFQAQLASTLADQTINTPMPVPTAAAMPPGASVQLRAFLLLRFQLAKERAQLWNQNLSTDPTARIALLRQWEQQNTARISQLQQQAQALAPAQN